MPSRLANPSPAANRLSRPGGPSPAGLLGLLAAGLGLTSLLGLLGLLILGY